MEQQFEKQVIKKLTDRDHLLLRPAMYIGSVDINKKTGYLLDENNKFKYQEYNVIDGLLKIINEIVDNSIDEAIRTNFTFANKIEVVITDKSVKIVDNGRGIPVEKMENSDTYMPVACFTEAKTGANFLDEDKTVDRATIGMNGVGSFATNVFSKNFVAETDDGNHYLKLTCSENCLNIDFEIEKTKKKKGTIVYFEPDFERFGLNELDFIYCKLIKQRMVALSMSFPKISFYFNNEHIKMKTTNEFFEKYFEEKFIVQEKDNYIVGVSTNESEDFKQMSFVNGLELFSGGAHIDYLYNTAVSILRDKIAKKYKNIKPGDIKNKIQVVMFLKNFPSPEFDSQTKQKLTNSQSKLRNYFNDNFEDFAKKLFNESSIVDPITEVYKIKEEYEKRKLIKDFDKETDTKKIRIEKFLQPTKLWNRLLLVEGLSAQSSLVSILGREENGFYALKGVPQNVYELDFQKVMKNKEFGDIKTILGIRFSKEKEEENSLKFNEIVIATDRDADGSHISGLLLTFFHKFIPSSIRNGKIKLFKTPLVVASKNNKIVNWFFDFNEYNEFIKINGNNYEFSYKKGLGSWKASELKEIIQKVGLDNMLETFVYDQDSENIISLWMAECNSNSRKEFILDNEFDIYKA